MLIILGILIFPYQNIFSNAFSIYVPQIAYNITSLYYCLENSDLDVYLKSYIVMVNRCFFSSIIYISKIVQFIIAQLLLFSSSICICPITLYVIPNYQCVIYGVMRLFQNPTLIFDKINEYPGT